MLAAEGLRVERGGRVVLEAVSTALRPGEVTALVGPNGAGKSTLLAALAGLLPPAVGVVTLGGVPIAAMPSQERARAIGFLPQQGEVAWNLSVRALVGLGRLPWRGSATPGEDTAAVVAALAALDLDAFAERPVASLSGGERARALLARVLATGPRWILADEPLAALDLGHQLALVAHLRALAQQGAGVVLVLHDLALAMNHADRVVVLGEGQLKADGPPGQALDPATIAAVWGVDAEWAGPAGARGLLVRGHAQG